MAGPMRLSKLTIHGFRAFPPEEETFNFNGGNVAIVGDNGTGKSSILAAVEFLLSGNLTHLSGTGTSSLNLRDHVPHQEATAEECYVEGEFRTSDGETGTVRRSASNSSELESVSGDIGPDDIDVSQWNDDHLILTRGELLEFIEATPRDRGEELSKLLNLQGVMNRTQGFDQIRDTVSTEAEDIERDCRERVSDISSSLGIDLQFPVSDDAEDRIREEINEKLALLQSEQIDSIDDLDSGMESIELEVAGELQDTFYQAAVQNRAETCLSNLEEFGEVEASLQALSHKLTELEGRETEALERIDLFETADRLIEPQTAECPLCGERHEEEFLQQRIRTKLDRLSDIEELRDDIQALSDDIVAELKEHEEGCSELVDSLSDGIEVGNHEEKEEDIEHLRQFSDELEELVDSLSAPLIEHDDSETLQITTLNPELINVGPEEATSALRSIIDYMGGLEPRDKYTDAHADLVRVQDALEELHQLEANLVEVKALEEEMEEVVSLFAEAREESLASLYSSIEGNFNDYYTTINPDEEEIDLTLDYDGTDSVDIEAQHGEHRDSPLAFHSEGHLDTMGVCLFLALREELDTSGANIVLMDDIVMSVDKNHRRGVARLLADYFDDETQAILATHDEVWSDQLQGRGIIPSGNVIEIADWELSTGPVMTWGNWGLIQEKLDQGDPHAAAAHLRRTAEKVGRIVAIRLQVSVQYKERYTLGDYINAINSQLKTVASKAKGQHPDESEIWKVAKDIDDARSDLWGDAPINELNRMVHYNRDEWGQLTSEDLQDVLDRWKEIDDLITCEGCECWISYTRDGDYRWVQCDCRSIQFGYEK